MHPYHAPTPKYTFPTLSPSTLPMHPRHTLYPHTLPTHPPQASSTCSFPKSPPAGRLTELLSERRAYAHHLRLVGVQPADSLARLNNLLGQALLGERGGGGYGWEVGVERGRGQGMVRRRG
eukprot:365534-Chlamydomonas_euryale.AAC.13